MVAEGRGPVLLTGGGGFLGRAVLARLPAGVWAPGRAELDLTDGAAVAAAIAERRPRVVVHLAARVGGITENMARPADFLVDNLRMDANLLAALRAHPPAHLVGMLSTCMYPDRMPDEAYPLDEDRIDAGPPPPTNAAYAIAKRALWHGTLALHAQYGVPYTLLVPSNLYGPGDHFGEGKSHFVAAAVHRLEQARREGAARVTFFGTGRALRQFLYVDDLARLVAEVVAGEPLDAVVNVASSHNHSIRELAGMVAAAVGYEGEVCFSGEGPDGQLRKDVDNGRLRARVPAWDRWETSFADGARKTVEWYRDHVATR